MYQKYVAEPNIFWIFYYLTKLQGNSQTLFLVNWNICHVLKYIRKGFNSKSYLFFFGWMLHHIFFTKQHQCIKDIFWCLVQFYYGLKCLKSNKIVKQPHFLDLLNPNFKFIVRLYLLMCRNCIHETSIE